MKSSDFGRGVRVEAIEKRQAARWLNLTRLHGLPETARVTQFEPRTFRGRGRLAHSISRDTIVHLPAAWRLLRTAPADGPWNMACDLALMAVARADGVGILRVYGWSEPTVSFGRHERTAGIYTAESLAGAGLASVRRPTGGRALLHSREVTYSVAMPIPNDARWRAAYDLVNPRLCGAMQLLGVPARIVGTSVGTGIRASIGRGTDTRICAPVGEQKDPRSVPDVEGGSESAAKATQPEDAPVCFSGIVEGEIAVGEHKLIASSVWRERGAYLQHGSMLIHDDQYRLTALRGPDAAPPARAAVLSDWVTPAAGPHAIADAVQLALHEAFRDCGKCEPWSIPRGILDEIETARSRLAKPDWLWRR